MITRMILITFTFLSCELAFAGGPVSATTSVSVTCTGKGDDKAINAAISTVNASGGGSVIVNPGTCMIDAVNTHVVMKSNVFLKLTSRAVLQAITNSSGVYQIVQGVNIVNAGITGGQIIGDLTTHTGTAGEWGYGIFLGSVTGFSISNTTISNCWGDGILINDAGNSALPSKNVSIDNVISDRNRRQGLSGMNWVNGSITNSTFSNTGTINGTSPKCGIDFEPDLAAQQVTNISITNNTFSNNVGSGIDFSGVSGNVGNNTVSKNTFLSNVTDGIRITDSSNNIISGNSISGSGLEGISLGIGETSRPLPAWGASSHNLVSGNIIENSNQGNTTGMDLLVTGYANNNTFTSNVLTSLTGKLVFAGVYTGPATVVGNVFINTQYSGTWRTRDFYDDGSVGTVLK